MRKYTCVAIWSKSPIELVLILVGLAAVHGAFAFVLDILASHL